jgi:hypothetical protein
LYHEILFKILFVFYYCMGHFDTWELGVWDGNTACQFGGIGSWSYKKELVTIWNNCCFGIAGYEAYEGLSRYWIDGAWFFCVW